jgi:hypothetical protein
MIDVSLIPSQFRDPGFTCDISPVTRIPKVLKYEIMFHASLIPSQFRDPGFICDISPVARIPEVPKARKSEMKNMKYISGIWPLGIWPTWRF